MMRSVNFNFGLAALISFILLLPFAILQFTFGTVTKTDAPGLILLFGLLWILPVAFIVTLAPIMRAARAGNRVVAKSLLLRVACLVLIAMMWGSLLADQLPCFLGIPNCD